jgi:hypothetical protein
VTHRLSSGVKKTVIAASGFYIHFWLAAAVMAVAPKQEPLNGELLLPQFQGL